MRSTTSSKRRRLRWRLPIEPAWKPAVRSNLEVTLRLAAAVADFPLPDEAEPAPVFVA